MKLLVISYYYPPYKGIGGKRMFRFVSRLPALDIHPVVLTTPWPPAADRDVAQPFDAEGVTVDREYVPEWFWRMYHGENGGEYQPGPLARTFATFGRVAGQPIDAKSWLAPFAFQRSLALAQEHRFDAVLSTSAPYSSHLVAMRVAKRLGIPFFADLRDPWTFNFFYKKRPPLMRALDRQAEKSVFSSAKKIFFAAKSTEEKYAEVHPAHREKFRTIYSGFERDSPEAEVAEWPVQPRPRIAIAHFGRFYGIRRMDRLMSSLVSALDTHRLVPADLQLLILGDVSKVDKEQLHQLGLDSFVSISPMMPYEKGLSILRGADVLFLCDYDMEPYFVPGKLFDYLRVRKPIFALSANEELRALVHDTRTGIALHPDDVQGQVHIWGQIAKKGPVEALSFQPNEEALALLSADDAARQLAKALTTH